MIKCLTNDVLALFQTQYLQPQNEASGLWQCVKEDPRDTFHEPMKQTTHTVLQVQDSELSSPGPNCFSVCIFNGSNGMNIPVTVRSTYSVRRLQQKVLKLRPDLGASLDLVYNGKPVQLHQRLSELQVKPGAMFITYQKCHGG